MASFRPRPFDLERRVAEIQAEFYCDRHYALRILARRGARARAGKRDRAQQHAPEATKVERYKGPRAFPSAPPRQLPYRADIDGWVEPEMLDLMIIFWTVLALATLVIIAGGQS